jgi:hypothetical protein
MIADSAPTISVELSFSIEPRKRRSPPLPGV